MLTMLSALPARAESNSATEDLYDELHEFGPNNLSAWRATKDGSDVRMTMYVTGSLGGVEVMRVP